MNDVFPLSGLHFLPAWPLQLHPMVGFGVVLLFAVVAGEAASRLYLPRISAYVLTGVLLSFVRGTPEITGLVPAAHQVYELAFALLLFELGQRIDLGWLRRNPWLLLTSLAESGLAFAAVGALMLLFGQPPIAAAMIAGLAVATGPAVVLGICKDTTARGQITDRVTLLCALNSCYSFIMIGIAFAWQHDVTAAPLTVTLLHPLYLVLGSVVLAALAAWAAQYLPARIKPIHSNQTLASVALIIITAALAETLQLSVIISLLCAGMLSRNLDRSHRLRPLDFGLISRFALIVVFIASGTLLQPETFAAAILPALGVVAARILAKGIGIFVFARPSGLSLRKASLLSIGMLPMSGATLLWVESTSSVWPALGEQVAAVVLTALLIMELIAPPALQFALHQADETREGSPA